MSDRRNPYHVLGLKKGATEIEIKEAYKVLARKHHPDRNPNDPGARERFIEIKEAYESLIERKTASPVLAQVEETNAEYRRAGVYRRLAIRAGSAFVGIAVVALGFFFRTEIEWRGRTALASGGTAKEAEKWLGPIADGNGPHAVEARLDLAERYHAAGDADSMVRILANADDSLSLAILGDLHVRAGRRDEARKAYERAIVRAKDAEASARAYAGLLASHDDAVAARVMADAEARFQGDPWLGWMVAVRELRATKPGAARRAVEGRDGMAANAVRAAAMITEARLLGTDLRRFEERKALVEDAVRILDAAAPTGTFGDFGWLSPAPELLRKRPADWRPITSLDASDVARELARSAAYATLGTEGHTEAIAAAKRARERDAKSLDALLALGAAHLARGAKEADDAGQARGAFQIARSTDPKSARAAAGLAMAIGLSRPEAIGLKAEYDGELALWREAMQLEPQNGEWAFGYARALARGGSARTAERIAANRTAIRLAPDFGRPRLDLADALFARNELGEAVKVLQAATAIPEAAPKAWKELGDYYYFAKQYPAALTAYRNATADPDASAQAAAWYGAAKTLGRLKKEKEAHEAVDRAILLDRDLKPDHNDPAMAWVFRNYKPKVIERGEDVRAETRGGKR